MTLRNSPSMSAHQVQLAMAAICLSLSPDDYTTPRAFTNDESQKWTPLLVMDCIYNLQKGALDQQILAYYKRTRSRSKKFRRMSRNQRKKYNRKYKKRAGKRKHTQMPSTAQNTTPQVNEEMSAQSFLEISLEHAFQNLNIRPLTSSFVQVRQKIKSSVMRDVFNLFTGCLIVDEALEQAGDVLTFFIDGSNLAISVNYDEEENVVSTRGKPRAALHLTAATCMELGGIIVDAEIQSFTDKNERTAAMALICRLRERFPDKILRFVMDRGFYSAAMACLTEEKEVQVIFRMKYNVFATLSQGEGLDAPIDKDIDVQFTNTKKLAVEDPDHYVHVAKSTLDLSMEENKTKRLSARLISAQISKELEEAERSYREQNHEREEDKDKGDKYTGFTYILTNIPASGMSSDEAARYYERWLCETGFGLLKYKAGMAGFHSKYQNQIEQEIWLSLLKYNATVSTLLYYADKLLNKPRRSKKKARKKDRKISLPASELGVEKSKVPNEGNGYIRKLSFSAMSRCMILFHEGKVNELDIYYEMKQTMVYTIPGRHMPRGNLAKPYKGFQWVMV